MKKLFVLLLGITFFFIGCETKKMSDKNEIKIGVITPLTGDGATYGEATKRGIELALGDRKDIKLIYEDSKLNQKDSVNAIKKLIFQDKVDAIFGPFASSNVLAVAPIAEKNKVLLFTASATADDIKNAGQYIFRNVPANKMQGVTAANFIKNKLNKNSVYIYNMYNDYGISLKKSFVEQSSKLDLTIVAEGSFQPKEKNFKSVLLKIKSVNPDVVFFPGHYTECGLILKQAREIGITSIFIGTDGAYSPTLIDIAKESAEGSYYTLMAIDKKTQKYKNFEDNYKKRYNNEPDTYATYAYDAFNILLSLNFQENLLKQLTSEAFNTVSMGETHFDNYGEVSGKFHIFIVKKGEFIDE